jgi:hypothetical protein
MDSINQTGGQAGNVRFPRLPVDGFVLTPDEKKNIKELESQFPAVIDNFLSCKNLDSENENGVVTLSIPIGKGFLNGHVRYNEEDKVITDMSVLKWKNCGYESYTYRENEKDYKGDDKRVLRVEDKGSAASSVEGYEVNKKTGAISMLDSYVYFGEDHSMPSY